MNDNRRRILTMIALAFALATSIGLNKTVFIANSPQINPDLVKGVVYKFPQLAYVFSNILKTGTQTLPKGVSAKTEGNITTYDVQTGKIEWVYEDYITKSGRVIKIAYPKGQKMSTELLELLYP